MPTFQYQALDARGKKKKGFIESDSKAAAFSQLQDRGLMPVKMEPVADKVATGGFSLSALKPSAKVRVGESFYYLGMLLQSGISLAQALDLIARMSQGTGSRVWMDIRDDVEAGNPFSQTLKKHPKLFPSVYVGMIQVAESVGKLGEVLEQVAKYEETRGEVSGKLTTAMAYPMVILVVGLGAVYFLLSQVLPKIINVFQSANKELAWNTKLLISIGQTFDKWGVMVFVPPAVVILCFWLVYKRVPALRSRVDGLKWKLPLVQKNILARFSGLLGFQLEAGIPLVQAMESSAGAVKNEFFKGHILAAREEVATGHALDRVLAKTGIFPEIYVLTVFTGRKSGRLGGFLLRLSRLMERDVDNTMKRLVALAEPLLILGVGLVLAFIVMAIMGPIFDLSTLVK